jgi:general secretion pathway protein E
MNDFSSIFHAPDLCVEFGKIFRERIGADATRAWAEALLLDAMRVGASDIHIDSHRGKVAVRFRIDGVIHGLATLPQEPGQRLLRFFKVHAGLDPAPSLCPEDARFHMEIDGKERDVRLSCAPCIFGDKLALRVLHRSSVKLRLGDLGLRGDDCERIRGWLGDISGMLVVTGPVGCGKTTTLYALLAELNLGQRNIVTIEDPVEYELETINQMEVDPDRGVDFSGGLRAILRLDPDYILLGEIRDKASALTAMEAAGSGRVLLTTMHSRNAAGVVTAFRSLGIPNYEIAASLGFVVAQRLVRKLCPDCREMRAPSDFERRWFETLGENRPDSVWQAVGCPSCHQSGYQGRTGIFEVLPVDESFYDSILSGQDEHGLRRALRDSGFRLLLKDGLEKAARGITDLPELTRIGAQSYLDYPEGNRNAPGS